MGVGEELETMPGDDGAAHGAGVNGEVAVAPLSGQLNADGEESGVESAAAEPFYR